MFLLVTLAAGILAVDVASSDFERLVTAALTLVNTLLIWRVQYRAKTRLEPKVDKIAAITTRVAGERQLTGEHEPWDGTERRCNNG